MCCSANALCAACVLRKLVFLSLFPLVVLKCRPYRPCSDLPMRSFFSFYLIKLPSNYAVILVVVIYSSVTLPHRYVGGDDYCHSQHKTKRITFVIHRATDPDDRRKLPCPLPNSGTIFRPTIAKIIENFRRILVLRSDSATKSPWA